MANDTLLDIAMIHAEGLILKAQSGDSEAYNRLVGLWYKRIYNYCLKYAGSHDLAMDITQNTFITVHQKLGQLRNISSFKPWLYKVAINCGHEELRKQKRSLGYSLSGNDVERNETHMQIHGALEDHPDAKLERRELAEIIMNALQSLGEEQRVVVIMKEYEGLKFREIAEVLDISENTAKSRLYYGLKHLRTRLSNRLNDKKSIVS